MIMNIKYVRWDDYNVDKTLVKFSMGWRHEATHTLSGGVTVATRDDTISFAKFVEIFVILAGNYEKIA